MDYKKKLLNDSIEETKTKSYIESTIINKNILILDDGIEDIFIYKKILNQDLIIKILEEINIIEFDTTIKSITKDRSGNSHENKVSLYDKFFEKLTEYNYIENRPDSMYGFRFSDSWTPEKDNKIVESQKRILKIYNNIFRHKKFHIECPHHIFFKSKENGKFNEIGAFLLEFESFISKYKNDFQEDVVSTPVEYEKWINYIKFNTKDMFSQFFGSNIKKIFYSLFQNEQEFILDNSIYLSFNNLYKSDYFKENKFLINFFNNNNTFNSSYSIGSMMNNSSDNHNLFYIDTLLEKNNIENTILKKIDNNNIDTLLIYNEYILENIDIKKIQEKYPNLSIISENSFINYTNITKENVLLNSFDKDNSLKSNIIKDTFYTGNRKFFNIETLRLKNVFLFNYIKKTIYLENSFSLNPLNQDISFSYHSDSNMILNKLNSEIFHLEIEQKLQLLSEKKLNFNIINLDIEDKNDVLNISNISNNYKYLELFFEKIDGEFIQTNTYNLSWFLTNKDFEKNDMEYFFIDTILKKYKKDVLFLLTEEGSKYRNAQDFINLRNNFSISEKAVKDEILKYKKEILSLMNINMNSLTSDEENIINELNQITDKLFFSLLFDRNFLLMNDISKNSSTLGIKMTKMFNVIRIFITNKHKEGFFNSFKNISYNDISKFINNSLNFQCFENFTENSKKWFRINYELDRVFSIKKLFHDFDRVLSGENIYNDEALDFKDLKLNIEKLSSLENYQKMKEHYILKTPKPNYSDNTKNLKDITAQQKELLEMIEKDHFKKETDDLKELYCYYFLDLYETVKSQQELKHIDINKASRFFNTIPNILLDNINSKDSLEKVYIEQKVKIASTLDDRYLIFKYSEFEELESLKQYEVFKENTKSIDAVTQRLLSSNDDIVIESIYNCSEFYILFVLRVLLNISKIFKGSISFQSIINSDMLYDIRIYYNRIEHIKTEIQRKPIDSQNSFLEDKDIFEKVRENYYKIVNSLEEKFPTEILKVFELQQKKNQPKENPIKEKCDNPPQPKEQKSKIEMIFESMDTSELLERMSNENNADLREYFKELISKKM